MQCNVANAVTMLQCNCCQWIHVCLSNFGKIIHKSKKNPQLKKIFSEKKDRNNINYKKTFQDGELPHELFLNTRQYANNMSTDMKLTKAQKFQSGDHLVLG